MMTVQASQADLRAYLTRLTNLRELNVSLELTAATLAAPAPLTALTKLCLVRSCPGHLVSMQWLSVDHEHADCMAELVRAA